MSGWRVFLPVILGNAIAQSLLILGDPVAVASWAFGLSVAGSMLAVVTAVWLATCAALAAVDGRPRAALGIARSRVLVLGWIVGLAALAIAGGIWDPLITPLVLLLGTFVLPAGAAGERNPVVAGFAPVGSVPLRFLLAVLVFVLLVAASWLVALLLGFFVTGLLSAALTWIWFGIVLVLVLCLWCNLYRRARRIGGRQAVPGGSGF